MDSLAQAYGWSFDKIMSMTMPQLIMLNASAEVNRLRAEERYERKQAIEERKRQKQEEEDEKNPYLPEFGKRFDELNSEEQGRYFRNQMKRMRRHEDNV